MVYQTSLSDGKVLESVKLYSLLLTAASGGAAVAKIYRGQDTSVNPILTVKSAQDTTNQVYFGGILFPSGFTIVLTGTPDCNLLEFERCLPDGTEITAKV